MVSGVGIDVGFLSLIMVYVSLYNLLINFYFVNVIGFLFDRLCFFGVLSFGCWLVVC